MFSVDKFGKSVGFRSTGLLNVRFRSTGLLNVRFGSTGRQVCYKYTFLVDRSTGLLNVRFGSTGRQVCEIYFFGRQVDRFAMCLCFYCFTVGRQVC